MWRSHVAGWIRILDTNALKILRLEEASVFATAKSQKEFVNMMP